MPENVFSRLSDDVILNIFFKLEEDPRHWPRLACVSTKFSALIWDVCCKSKCCKTMPSVVTDLLFDGAGAESAPPGGWAALYKLAVSCPGVLQAGVLLENSDFGLQRELGPEESFQRNQPPPEYSQQNQQPPPEYSQQNQQPPPGNSQQNQQPPPASFPRNQQPPPPPSSALPPPCLSGCGSSDVEWSLYDDLFYDTVYDASESGTAAGIAAEKEVAERDEAAAAAAPPCKKRKVCRSLKPHLAKGVWNLSREQGNKLLASRFKGDCLYICDWPGCVHMEEKRNYMLFRGIFKNFKQSRVWRTINDGHRSKIEVNCAFCSCKETWDLHSAFCLRRYFGFHDDGEPVVRAYVCENGHVSGAWTDWPLYT